MKPEIQLTFLETTVEQMIKLTSGDVEKEVYIIIIYII